MPSNKKQRGREEKKKKIEAQKEAKRAVEEQQAQQDAEKLRARLRGLFGTPAIDEVITDMARSSISTAPSTATATTAVAAASTSSSSSSLTTKRPDGVMACYHGSSAEHFVPGSKYLQMVTSYVSLLKKFGDGAQQKDASDDFFCDTENQTIIFDDEFTNFVFALAVALYFNLPEKEKDVSFYVGLETWEEQKATAMHELRVVITMGLNIKYAFKSYNTLSKQERSDNRVKLVKKFREMGTERGLIIVLSSETKTIDCDCMAIKKSEAKDMKKMQRCNGCREEFDEELSNGLMKCKCNMTHYCSEACQIAHWPRHKLVCNKKKTKKIPAVSRRYRQNGGNTSNNDDEKVTKK